VVRRNGVQELRPGVGFELRGALLDQAQAEVDVAEQAALIGLPEGWPAFELERPADVVEQRGCQDEIRAQSWMKLRPRNLLLF
jgi:hypothetical protein